MMNIDKEILKVDELAKLLGISRKNAYDLVNSEGFPAFRPSPRSIRVFKSDALEWIKTNCMM